MINKTVILTFIILIITTSVYCQKISKIDFDDIKIKTTDSTSEFYYPKILKKFTDSLMSLSKEELKCVYYGYVFTKDYNPMGNSKEEIDLNNYYKNKDYENAVVIAKNLVIKDPTNIEYNYHLGLIFLELNDTINTRRYIENEIYLLQTIYQSGNGECPDSAFVVTRVSDEYQVLRDRKLEFKSQALIGECDFLAFKQPDKNNLKGYYFNVKYSLDYLREMIKKYNPEK